MSSKVIKNINRKPFEIFEVQEENLAKLSIKKYGLTKRESELFICFFLGLSNNQIGEKLFISFKTVKFHVGHIMEKMGTNNKLQAVLRAIHDLKVEEIFKVD